MTSSTLGLSLTTKFDHMVCLSSISYFATVIVFEMLLNDVSSNKLPVLSYFQFRHADFFNMTDFSDVPILKLQLQKLLFFDNKLVVFDSTTLIYAYNHFLFLFPVMSRDHISK